MRTISETIRLIILILLLPLALVFIGPLLVLAAFRGQQGMGPIVWDTSRYNPAGRLGILGLGLVLWLLIWGGLGWLFLNTSFQPVLAQIIPPTAMPAEAIQEAVTPPSPTSPPSSTAESQAASSPTIPATSSPTSPPSSTPTSPALTSTPAQAVATATSTATPSLEAEPAAELSPTQSPSPTLAATEFTPDPSPTGTPAVTPTPQPTPTFGERQTAVESVKRANVLLRDAIALANDENIGKLEVVWQGKALTVIENFALDLYDRYTQPFTVTFEYIKLPASQVQPETGQVVITSQERWSYTGPTTTNREAFEFIYSLERVNERWVITSYTYRNLPTPAAIPPTRTPPPTGTPTPSN